MPIDTSYVAELRRRIQDVRPSRRAITFQVTDGSVSRCIAEITKGRFIITPSGGSAARLDLALSDSRYDTIGGLHQALSRASGYVAQLDEDANSDHPSVDLESFGPIDCKTTGIELRHHTFADSELDDIILGALRRHNPSFTLSTLPPQEWTFVLPLAHSEVCKVQAYDASKRRGLDKDVNALIQLSNTFEQQYKDDRERLARSIQSPREANPNLVDEGDVMLGTLNRMSLRTGYMSPVAKALPPDAAILLETGERDVEDDNVRISWQRNKNVDFHGYELWMDATPEVIREGDNGLAGRSPNWLGENQQTEWRDVAVRQTTSHQVFQSQGPNQSSAKSTFNTYVQEMGQSVRAFAVGGLESETTYYFRLFLVSTNFLVVGSNVIKVTTKPLRCRFASPTYVSAMSGVAGAVVTVTCDPTKGTFTANHSFRVGEKKVTPTILTPYTFTFVVPTFEHKGFKDLVIISPTMLIDVRHDSFEVKP